MKTSCYSKYNGLNAISIAGECPEWYKGKQYKKLAPKYWFWKKWHDGEFSDIDYVKYYYSEVLDKLDAQEVYNQLGEDSVLLWDLEKNTRVNFHFPRPSFL